MHTLQSLSNAVNGLSSFISIPNMGIEEDPQDRGLAIYI